MATRGEKGGATAAYSRIVEATTKPSRTHDGEGLLRRLRARKKAAAAGVSERRLDEIHDNAVTRALRHIGIHR